MHIGDKEIWQIAADDTHRSYADLCLRWGLVLFGPGYRGMWPDCEEPLRVDEWSSKKINMIRKYHEDIHCGDLVVLRLGTSEVYGVGLIEGPVQWFDDFGDVDGWDVQLARRVRWLWKPEDGPKTFSPGSLKWGDTVQKLARSGTVFQWLLGMPEQDWGLPDLPPSFVSGATVQRLELAEIAQHLFDEGTAAGAINDLTDNMQSLRQIASWYERTNSPPSEAETVAYLVAPLLRTLGWTPQRMAVEWHRIDVALFSRLPRADGNLSTVVEVKQLGSSCLSAKSQAAQYAQGNGRRACTRLIVTDGIRYGVYLRNLDGAFPEMPAAYMNLTRLVGAYPALGCEGAPQALSLLAADWRHTAGGLDMRLDHRL